MLRDLTIFYFYCNKINGVGNFVKEQTTPYPEVIQKMASEPDQIEMKISHLEYFMVIVFFVAMLACGSLLKSVFLAPLLGICTCSHMLHICPEVDSWTSNFCNL